MMTDGVIPTGLRGLTKWERRIINGTLFFLFLAFGVKFSYILSVQNLN